MNLDRHFRKHVWPTLKRAGLKYRKPIWVSDKEDSWRIAVETSSRQHSDGRWYIGFDVGLFSFEIDAITDAVARDFEVTPDDLPFGVITCHFESSLFDLTESGDWKPRSGPPILYDSEIAAAEAIRLCSKKFEQLLPTLVERYANLDAIVYCRTNRIGQGASSHKFGLFAAAACILLKRYDEARSLVGECIRPGSTPYDKSIGSNLLDRLP